MEIVPMWRGRDVSTPRKPRYILPPYLSKILISAIDVQEGWIWSDYLERVPIPLDVRSGEVYEMQISSRQSKVPFFHAMLICSASLMRPIPSCPANDVFPNDMRAVTRLLDRKVRLRRKTIELRRLLQVCRWCIERSELRPNSFCSPTICSTFNFTTLPFAH